VVLITRPDDLVLKIVLKVLGSVGSELLLETVSRNM